MNTTAKSPLNIVLWIVVLALFIAGIWANHTYSGIDFSLRLIGWVVLVIVAGAIAYQTSQGHRLWSFAKDSRNELRKVVWPTRQETVQTTVMVVILIIIVALIIWGIDTIFLHLIGWLTGQRG